MYQNTCGPFARRAPLLVLITLAMSLTAARAQCVDSSTVTGLKVRSVKVDTLLGGVPDELRKTLQNHKSEPYSADRAIQYINEIKAFYAGDPAQAKYERLIADKLKLSVKAGRTELKCVEKAKQAECQLAFPGVTECVDVTIKRYFVDVDVLNSSPYLLLFPRSAKLALYGAIPRPLLALNPGLDMSQDKRFGPAASIDTATDLLDLKKIFGAEPSPSPTTSPVSQPIQSPAPSPDSGDVEIGVPGGSSPGGSSSGGLGDPEPPVDVEKTDNKLLFRFKGLKSLTKDFYDTSTGLALSRRQAVERLQNLALEASFDSSHVPRGNGDFFSNAAMIGFNADLRLKPQRHHTQAQQQNKTKQNKGGFKLINIGGDYRWSRNRFVDGNGSTPVTITTEHELGGRVLLDGTLANGLARAAVWFDGATLDRGRGSFGRAAALIGYGKEFVIHRKKVFHQISPAEVVNKPCWTSYPDPKKPGDRIKNEQTFGFELLAGAGRTWGAVPEYSRFYAGSPPGQFLYDEISARTMTSFPSGPLIRSLPRSQGGVAIGPGNVVLGGTSYWHANVSVSIPVSSWSSPLIPHEWVATRNLPKDEPKTNAARAEEKDEEKEKEDQEFRAHGAAAGAPICVDLKGIIKTLVRVSGVNLLINQEARDLLTDAQKNDLRLRNKPTRTAEEQSRLDAAELNLKNNKERVTGDVKELFNREVLPVTDFIADHANIIAVKPLLMFDVARLTQPGSGFNITRYGFGGGLQIDVVLARFELGYVTALKRASGDPTGQFFGRLVLKRFF